MMAEKRFIVIYKRKSPDMEIVLDTRTGARYIHNSFDFITPLIDENGSPIVAKGEDLENLIRKYTYEE